MASDPIVIKIEVQNMQQASAYFNNVASSANKVGSATNNATAAMKNASSGLPRLLSGPFQELGKARANLFNAKATGTNAQVNDAYLLLKRAQAKVAKTVGPEGEGPVKPPNSLGDMGYAFLRQQAMRAKQDAAFIASQAREKAAAEKAMARPDLAGIRRAQSSDKGLKEQKERSDPVRNYQKFGQDILSKYAVRQKQDAAFAAAKTRVTNSFLRLIPGVNAGMLRFGVYAVAAYASLKLLEGGAKLVASSFEKMVDDAREFATAAFAAGGPAQNTGILARESVGAGLPEGAFASMSRAVQQAINSGGYAASMAARAGVGPSGGVFGAQDFGKRFQKLLDYQTDIIRTDEEARRFAFVMGTEQALYLRNVDKNTRGLQKLIGATSGTIMSADYIKSATSFSVMIDNVIGALTNDFNAFMSSMKPITDRIIKAGNEIANGLNETALQIKMGGDLLIAGLISATETITGGLVDLIPGVRKMKEEAMQSFVKDTKQYFDFINKEGDYKKEHIKALQDNTEAIKRSIVAPGRYGLGGSGAAGTPKAFHMNPNARSERWYNEANTMGNMY